MLGCWKETEVSQRDEVPGGHRDDRKIMTCWKDMKVYVSKEGWRAFGELRYKSLWKWSKF